jgi:hypothetical protein
LRLRQTPDRHQVLGSTIGVSGEDVEHASLKCKRNTKELPRIKRNGSANSWVKARLEGARMITDKDGSFQVS